MNYQKLLQQQIRSKQLNSVNDFLSNKSEMQFVDQSQTQRQMEKIVEKNPRKRQRGVSRQRWSSKEDAELKKAIKKCGLKWLSVAQLMPERNPNQCSQRWKKLNECASYKKNFWTPKDDKKLEELVNQYGKKWKIIEMNFIGRSCRQCRERYQNALDPSIKREEFSTFEDQILYEQYLVHGQKWSIIAKYLPGRSPSHVKNRFYIHIRKNYLQINNPYFSKTIEEEAKIQLIEARQMHLQIIYEDGEEQSRYLNAEELDFKSSNIFFRF